MSYIVVAKWTAQTGNEDAVARALGKLAGPSRAESGCLEYRVHRSVSDGRVFLLYEEYVDEAAYAAHADSDHFAAYALGEGIPLLESRERKFYAPLGSDSSAADLD
jgi:quinol monooxygenase YgiN